MKNITSKIREYCKFLLAAEEETLTDQMPAADPAIPETPAAPEENDQDTLLQDHVKNNIDKYRMAFENLFPNAQMVAKNVEYHGASVKDKIRVLVDFETPLLNFDALKIMANKEIGIEAVGENAFRVYNIYLPKVKDPSIEAC